MILHELVQRGIFFLDNDPREKDKLASLAMKELAKRSKDIFSKAGQKHKLCHSQLPEDHLPVKKRMVTAYPSSANNEISMLAIKEKLDRIWKSEVTGW